ncbi:rRNA maturation RNase YbeY [Ichthyenterobacterium sp. W332]|uniref:Endoribonuclease YbeY n=1 Tax=Microcosmobacter mediterraneus TaxID=3075607 RepID=A0ABU2YIP9_9FLAO|nr:rRNA maturation RNase YbeY [Ichthyenterobacterium sp. W332]MDT0558031.1 rRNA maturation RNase YbeY [Ichthyenterobacterium sp. W332]
MINFYSELEFTLKNETDISDWLSHVIQSEDCKEGEINYIFCDDTYLHKVNLKYLDHDTLTDIISFDYSVGKELHGDIFISIDRVKDNALDFAVDFNEELRRVMVHGILHYCGYKDKTKDEKNVMRGKEEYYLNNAV